MEEPAETRDGRKKAGYSPSYRNEYSNGVVPEWRRHPHTRSHVGDSVVRQIKSTTIRHFILTGIAEKRSNKAYYKHLIRQIK